VPVVASQPGLLKWLLVFDVEVVSLTSPLKEETLIPQCPEELIYTHEQGIKARAALRSKLWSRWGAKY